MDHGILRRFLAFVLCPILAVGLIACGEDDPTTITPEETSRAVIGGGDLESGDFLLRVGGGSGSGLGFVVRGENLRYEEGAIAVDVTVTNDGTNPVPLPASLALVRITPDSVVVRDADNAMTGAGAAFDLEFADENLEWSPGEPSLPRTLRFEVQQGTPIAFVVRVDVGMLAIGGSIGGVIFEDLDTDGLVGVDETGIVGVQVELSGNGIAPVTTSSSVDGTYRFDGLAAGLYTVRTLTRPLLAATTDVQLQVVLSEDEQGEVGSFLNADFGFLFAPVPPVSRLEVGDRVEVTGTYLDDPHRIVALEVRRCDTDRDDDFRVDDDRWFGELRGPVTGSDGSGVLAIMGRSVDVDGLVLHGGGRDEFCKDGAARDLVAGDRARVRVLDPGIDTTARSAADTLEAVRASCWNGDKEKVHGIVESVVRGDDGRITGFTVLGLKVGVTASTRFDRDDHRGDDDDHD